MIWLNLCFVSLKKRQQILTKSQHLFNVNGECKRVRHKIFSIIWWIYMDRINFFYPIVHFQQQKYAA